MMTGLMGGLSYRGMGLFRKTRKRMSVIAQFVERVRTIRVMTEDLMCNDDDGMLISQIKRSVMRTSTKAFGILLSYYAHGSL